MKTDCNLCDNVQKSWKKYNYAGAKYLYMIQIMLVFKLDYYKSRC